MSIRTKILFIILLLSIPPILFLRISGMRSLDILVSQVQTRTSNLLMNNQSQSLQRIVEDHARLLKRERQLISAALDVLVTKTAKALDIEYFSKVLSLQSPKSDSRIHGSMHGHMMHKKNGVFLFSPTPAIKNSLAIIPPIMRNFSNKYSDLILWQEILLADNSQIFYSTDQTNGTAMPPLINSTMAKEKGSSAVWSMPMHDKRFNASIFTASQSIILSNGAIVGTATIAIPVKTLLRDPGHLSAISDNIISYIIKADAQEKTLIILAKRNMGEKEGKWFTVPKDMLNVPEGTIDHISKDILNGKSGSWVTEINGKKHLATYASFGIDNSALLITVPIADIIRAASKEKEVVRSLFSKQLSISQYLFGITLFFVCIAAVYFSHSLSKNIYKLVQGVRQIAKGDFSIRIANVGKDEIGELGAALNEMIPALEENVQLKTSLQLASEVQQRLLPQKAPQQASYDIAGASYYCAETGGDYFDFITPCVPKKSSGLLMAVGDVVGHGIPAALLMATARAYLRSSANHDISLSKITQMANDLVVCDTYGTGQFMTLFLSSLDTLRNTFTWTRAGHDAAIIYRRQQASFEKVKGKGATALGITSNAEYAENAISIHQGDILVIATDGIWECTAPDGTMFGKERMKNIIEQSKELSSQQIIDTLYIAALNYTEQSSLEDDFTCIVIQRKENL
ncbi:PP2C family protein-serine/threonine phosphatase [Halodesulfovibrio aestuarii]|uniref:SpoIIE family protein phosphatase n=1 Tax=Halodesulfovibrio aestuarii TaxID=126333 RepID=A0ABV4JRU3_9BACT